MRQNILILLLSILLVSITNLIWAQTTVTINATGSAGSYKTGSVTSGGTLTDGNMTVSNASGTTPIGWAVFDLSSLNIPVGATVTGATLKINKGNVSGSGNSPASALYGVAADESIDASAGLGANVFNDLSAGTAMSTTSFGTGSGSTTLTINTGGRTFLENNLSNIITIGLITTSNRAYTIYGYGGTSSQQPQLSITYIAPCTGKPNGGTATGPASVCSAADFTLSASGLTGIAAGVTYDWYADDVSGPVFLGNSTSTNASYTVTGGISSATSYYLVSTCTATGDTAMSTTMSVNVNIPAYCMCTTAADDIDEYISRVSATHFSNTTSSSYYTSYTGLGYIDTVSAGLSVTITVRVTYPYLGDSIWIYLDQYGTGTITAADIIGRASMLGNTSPESYPITCTIPITATGDASGLAGLRVKLAYTGSGVNGSSDPCEASFDYGEVEDYAIMIIPATTCSGSPNHATIALSSGSSACANTAFTLNASGMSAATDIFYDWQSNDGTGWASTGGSGTSYTVTAGIAQPVDYRMITWCQGSNSYDTSNVFTVTLKNIYECFCSPVNTPPTILNSYGAYDNFISGVTIVGTTLNNTSTSYNSTTGYAFRSPSAASNTADLLQGVPYTINVAMAYPGSDLAGVWVDFDKDGILGTPSEFITMTPTANGATGTITIPVSPTDTGLVGLRVRVNDDYWNYGTSHDACADDYYGETEDYVIHVSPAPSCIPPGSLSASNITAHSADVEWVENNSATQWILVYGPAPLNSLTADTAYPSINPYSLTNLTGGIPYEYAIQSVCAPGADTSIAALGSFRTPPGCGNNFYDNGGASGNYSDNSNDTVTIYPDNPGDQITVTFTSFRTESGYDYLFVYDDDGTNLTTSTQLAYSGSTNGGFNGNLTGSNLPGPFTASNPSGALTFVFTSDGGTNYGGWAASVTCALPATCLKPTTLSASNVTATSVDLSWTENNTATQWEIEYGPAPLIIGTGTVIGASSNPFSITSGIVPATNYEYVVRSVCTPGSDTSLPSAIGAFTTQCVPFMAPYTESFNGSSTPNCWTNTGSGTSSWQFSTGSGPDYDLSNIVADHTGNAGDFVWVDGSNVSGGATATMTSPLIDISTLTAPQLRYYAISYNPSYYATYGNNKIIVDAWDDNLQDWVQVDSFQESFSSAAWQERNVPLSVVTSTTTQVRFTFTATASTAYYNDILIDDINVEEVPACATPSALNASNITTTSADLEWIETGSATEWQIEYGQGTFTLGTGTRDTTTANPQSYSLGVVTPLTPGTQYKYYVRSICGVGDTSNWGGPYSFYTLLTNDECTGAIAITNQTSASIPSTTISTTNIGATESLPPITCETYLSSAANDVWYSVTPTTSGNLDFDVDNGQNGNLDAVMEILTGPCGSQTSVACVDDNWPLTVAVTANTTYYLRVYGYGGQTENFDLTVTGAPLAIRLGKISATNTGASNKVEWNTLSEDRDDKFYLQRSADGKTYENIYERDAEGEASRYTFVDNTPFQGVNYYRLLLKDVNGRSNYSNVVTATVSVNVNFAVEAYPNPVSDQLTLRVNGTQGNNARVQVTDIAGKVIRTVKMNGTQVNVDMHGLANGLYLIKYADADHTHTIRVTKQ